MVGAWVPPPRRPQKNFWGPVAGCRDPLLLLSRGDHRRRAAGSRRAASWTTIDAQVHAYERNHPGRPWESVPGFEDSSDLDCGCPPTIKNPCEQVLKGGACSSKTAYKLVSDVHGVFRR